MVNVYYDKEYSHFIENMSNENDFIKFQPFSLQFDNELVKDDIIILNLKKGIYAKKRNNVIRIDDSNFKLEDTFNLTYDINKVYVYFYNIFIPDINDRNFIISYNIYNKILNLINKKKHKIRYPINFDAIETYLKCVLTNKSFFRVGDGEQKIYDNAFPEVSKEIYTNTLNTLKNDYNYDNNKLFVCYNEIYYNGNKMIESERLPEYWTKENENQYFSIQQKHQNHVDIYYSSHCFRLIPHLNSMYSKFNKKLITMFLSKMFINKDIIIIDSKFKLNPFYNYKSRIDICYGINEKYPISNCITQKVTDFVLSTLDIIFKKNPEKTYVVFVKGACLSNLIANMYYNEHRICDVGSFKLKINSKILFEQKPSTIYNIS